MREREIKQDYIRIIPDEYTIHYIIWYDGDVDFGTYGLADHGGYTLKAAYYLRASCYDETGFSHD